MLAGYFFSLSYLVLSCVWVHARGGGQKCCHLPSVAVLMCFADINGLRLKPSLGGGREGCLIYCLGTWGVFGASEDFFCRRQ